MKKYFYKPIYKAMNQLNLFDVDELKQCEKGVRQGHLLALVYYFPHFKMTWYEVRTIINKWKLVAHNGIPIDLMDRKFERLINITTNLGADKARELWNLYKAGGEENLEMVEFHIKPLLK